MPKPFTGSASRRVSSSAPPAKFGEYMARVKGFTPGTFKDDLENALQSILDEVGVDIPKEDRFCPGRRNDYGLIKVTDLNKYRQLLKNTKFKKYPFTIKGKQVELEVVPKRSAEDMEETKELRALLRSLGSLSQIPRDSPNKSVLDVNYGKKEVYFGDEVVGEYPSSSSSESPVFLVHWDLIDKEAKRLVFAFTGEQAKAEYDKVLSSMPHQ